MIGMLSHRVPCMTPQTRSGYGMDERRICVRNMSKTPTPLRHIGIIMDGNGRWAQARGLARVRGHECGVDSVRAVTEEACRQKISQLTLYAFSSENWKRPKIEVSTLMRQLRRFLVEERGTIMDNDVRLTAIGHEHRLPDSVRRELDATREMSQNNKGTNLCLALSYGGRQEIADACRRIAEEVRAGTLEPSAVSEAEIQKRLYQPDMPEPDLVIRTGGELRVSNFLLWQLSYAELYVTEVLWPDFREQDLIDAIAAFHARERRYGGLVDQIGKKS